MLLGDANAVRSRRIAGNSATQNMAASSRRLCIPPVTRDKKATSRAWVKSANFSARTPQKSVWILVRKCTGTDAMETPTGMGRCLL